MRRSRLILMILCIVGAYLFFRYGIQPPIPFNLLIMYMFFAVAGILLYFTSTEESARAIAASLKSIFTDPSRWVIRTGIFIVFPIVAGYGTYSLARPSYDAPPPLRSVHPAPPGMVKMFGKSVNLQTLENPLRKNKEQYAQNAKEGGTLYFQHCFYCHGDKLEGKGHFAEGFVPKPANFMDVGTIAQLQESYLFWRIATGGPGLPKEGAPASSAMPVWEQMLTEEEIWKIVLFLYDYTGWSPRTW